MTERADVPEGSGGLFQVSRGCGRQKFAARQGQEWTTHAHKNITVGCINLTQFSKVNNLQDTLENLHDARVQAFFCQEVGDDLEEAMV